MITPDDNEQQHRARWLRRYGADYRTDAERHAAYALHQVTLATMRVVFGGSR